LLPPNEVEEETSLSEEFEDHIEVAPASSLPAHERTFRYG
jgi:hypothetical protein